MKEIYMQRTVDHMLSSSPKSVDMLNKKGEPEVVEFNKEEKRNTPEKYYIFKHE